MFNQTSLSDNDLPGPFAGIISVFAYFMSLTFWTFTMFFTKPQLSQCALLYVWNVTVRNIFFHECCAKKSEAW